MQRPRILVGVIQILLLVAASRGVTAQSLPVPWTSADVGAPTLAGSASYASGVFTLDGAGTDIWGTSDQCQFVYQQVSGDVEIVARVRGVTNQHPWSKAGVMIRTTLAANSAHASALVSAANGVRFQRRATAGGQSSSTAASTSLPPAWVKAVRSGNTVTTYWSADGSSWTTIGSVTLPLNTSAYVGIAVTSHNPGARTTATVSDVAVVRKALPAGQQSVDIGSPAPAGGTSYSSGAYTIKAGGTDIWGPADQFHFVYQPMTGDGEIVARVASLTNANAWSKAGVMIREALTAASLHASMFTSVSKGYAFQRRPETGEFSVHTSGGSGAPPGWVRLARTGDRFDAYRSADGVSWTSVGSDTIPMGDTVYVGLAVTSHNSSSTTTAVIDGVKITGSTSSNTSVSSTSTSISARVDSSLTLGSETPGVAAALAPADLTINGPTSVTVGQTAQYTAYSNGTRLTTGVWWYVKESTATIDHATGVLTAVAGGSATVRFDYVQGGVNTASTPYPVSLQTSGTPTGTTLSISGPTSVTVGSTAQYTAKAGSQTLTSGVWWYVYEGTATIDHATGILRGVSAGPATVRFDYVQGGVQQGKAAYPITINPTTASPTTTAPRLVVFTASTDHATNVTSYLLEVFAAGANPNTATPVATSNLGKPTPAANGDITVDRSAFFSGLASGSYVTTVSAIGPGGMTRSASVTFTR